ncbi:MAG: CmpA/NrtA family ABC transporter substrate-binding protein [Pseudomonadota bacterium]
MKIRAGFIPLVDCAVLVAAERLGFAGKQGVDLHLKREATWATIRDKLTIGRFQCAHLLAPMVVASQLQVGNPKAPLVAPFALSMNGNGISVSNAVHAEMAALGAFDSDSDPGQKARTLAAIVRTRAEQGDPPLNFGMVYPFSSHNYQLRYWLASGGINPDADVNLVVIPPPFVVDYLRDGHIDGFCVGAPWNTIGSVEGVSRLVVSASDLWHLAPEKVLGVREDWADGEPEALAALMRALMDAARFCDEPANRDDLARILAEPDVMGLDKGTIADILSGHVDLAADRSAPIPDYLVFHRSAATFPWRSHALWFYSQMVRWGQVALTPDMTAMAARSYRPDIYRRVFEGTDVDLPSANAKVEGAVAAEGPAGSTTGRLVLKRDGFFDERTFDPDHLESYITGFRIRTAAATDPLDD